MPSQMPVPMPSQSKRDSTPKKRLARLWTRQAVLNVGLVCLAAGAVCGKQMLLHFSLFAGGGNCQSPRVRNVQLTDIYLLGMGTGQGSLRVEWDGDAAATQFVNGASVGPPVLTNNNGHYVYTDTFTPQAGVGAKRVYSVQQMDPPPPPPPYPYIACTPSLSQPFPINVTPVQAVVTDNQTVDARYDPRYALWTHLNHNFGSTVNGQYVTNTYRGGLYVGYNGDNSQVGHAYLNFALPAVPQGQSVWPNVGSVNAYYLRSYVPGSTTVSCQSVSTAWSGSSLTWSSAPALSTGGTSPTATVSYVNQQPVSGWTHWSMGGDIPTALSGSGGYAAACFSPSEPSTASDPISGAASGWVYFSKKESASGQPACVLYAYSQ